MLSDSHSRGKEPVLELANGVTWGIAAADTESTVIVSKLRAVMKLAPGRKTPDRQVLLFAAGCSTKRRDNQTIEDALMEETIGIFGVGSKYVPPDPPPGFFKVNPGTVPCLVFPDTGGDILTVQMMQVADIIARQSERNGALLLHSALAEWNGHGIILAGPSGVGKTTNSERLPPSWRSLADDTTLVMPDGKGTYWAHPWPTWSQLMYGRWGSTWDVQRAIPVKGIFYLVQDREERVAPVGTAQAACLLANSITRPAWNPMLRRLTENETRDHCLNCFNNVCELARTVPCYLLHLTLKGAFWLEIERTVGDIALNPSGRPRFSEKQQFTTVREF